jgi:hypothetical protein
MSDHDDGGYVRSATRIGVRLAKPYKKINLRRVYVKCVTVSDASLLAETSGVIRSRRGNGMC